MKNAATMRLARLDDAPAIQEIYAPYVRETAVSFEETPPDAAEMAARIRSVTAVYPWIVLEAEGKVSGYAYASALRARAAWRWSVELSVYLHRRHAGKGYGGMLYTALIALVRAQNFCTVYGCLTLPNPASDRLHQRFGFNHIGDWKQSGFKHGKWMDTRWYAKQVAAGDRDPSPIIPLSELDQDIIAAILRREST